MSHEFFPQKKPDSRRKTVSVFEYLKKSMKIAVKLVSEPGAQVVPGCNSPAIIDFCSKPIAKKPSPS